MTWLGRLQRSAWVATWVVIPLAALVAYERTIVRWDEGCSPSGYTSVNFRLGNLLAVVVLTPMLVLSSGGVGLATRRLPWLGRLSLLLASEGAVIAIALYASGAFGGCQDGVY